LAVTIHHFQKEIVLPGKLAGIEPDRESHQVPALLQIEISVDPFGNLLLSGIVAKNPPSMEVHGNDYVQWCIPELCGGIVQARVDLRDHSPFNNSVATWSWPDDTKANLFPLSPQCVNPGLQPGSLHGYTVAVVVNDLSKKPTIKIGEGILKIA
jgi:hypothetical protein